MLDPSCLERWFQDHTANARNEVVESYRFLCRRAARRFRRRGVDVEDLEQIGTVGLIKAVDHYRFDHGSPFVSYAWALIVGELLHFVRDYERPIRIPRKIRSLHQRAQRCYEELVNSLGREPERWELRGALEISVEEWDRCERAFSQSLALSVEELPKELPSTDACLEEQTERIQFEQLIERLDTTERCVMVGLYLHDRCIADIARDLRYSTRHISRIRERALGKLRSMSDPLP